MSEIKDVTKLRSRSETGRFIYLLPSQSDLCLVGVNFLLQVIIRFSFILMLNQSTEPQNSVTRLYS